MFLVCGRKVVPREHWENIQSPLTSPRTPGDAAATVFISALLSRPTERRRMTALWVLGNQGDVCLETPEGGWFQEIRFPFLYFTRIYQLLFEPNRHFVDCWRAGAHQGQNNSRPWSLIWSWFACACDKMRFCTSFIFFRLEREMFSLMWHIEYPTHCTHKSIYKEMTHRVNDSHLSLFSASDSCKI